MNQKGGHQASFLIGNNQAKKYFSSCRSFPDGNCNGKSVERCLLACRVAPRHDNSHEDNPSNRSCLNSSRLGSTGISIHLASSGTSSSAFLSTGFLKLTLHSGHLSFRSSNELLDLSWTWLLPQGRPVTAGGSGGCLTPQHSGTM